jgi:hypothetical protein
MGGFINASDLARAARGAAVGESARVSRLLAKVSFKPDEVGTVLIRRQPAPDLFEAAAALQELGYRAEVLPRPNGAHILKVRGGDAP